MVISSLPYECYRAFLSAYIENVGLSLTAFSKHVGGVVSKTTLSLLLKKNAQGNYLRSHSLSDYCWASILDKLDMPLQDKQHLLMLKLSEDISLRATNPSLISLAKSLTHIQMVRPEESSDEMSHNRARVLNAALDFLPARFRKYIFSEVRTQIKRSKEANRYEAARAGLSRIEAEFSHSSMSWEN